MAQKTAVDKKKAEDFLFKTVADVGGAFIAAQAYLGDKFGLFRALAGQGKKTSAEVAEVTHLNERYVREWLKAMAAAEYVEYDPPSDKYFMTDEQAFVLADEDSPMFAGGAFQITTASILNLPKIADVFHRGGGVPLAVLGKEVIEGVERFFKPNYKHFLVNDWLPKISGMMEKLQKGGLVLDVGCGCGQSTIAMGKAFPRSTVIGVDMDPMSIEKARKLASDNSLHNTQFFQLPAHEVPRERRFDLITMFDCIHDMAQPAKTLTALRELLKPDGHAFWVEPNASENPLENRNLIGKVIAGVSPFYCLTVSLAGQGMGTGNQLGEKGARAMAKEAGFSSFEKLPVESPLNQFFLLRK